MGKRVFSSFLGIPITLWGAIFVFFILQTGYDLFVGDRNIIRYALLFSSVLGLLTLIGFAFMKKTTVLAIVKNSMGVR